MIHQYKLNGFNIVIDVNSGGIHLVDDITYDVINLLKEPISSKIPNEVIQQLNDKYNQNELEEVYSQVFELYENGMLFSSDDYEQFANMMISSPVKAMCLHVAHDCNLRCKYCFASTGDFGEGRKLLDEATGKMAIDFLLEHSKGRKNLELDFFGGEPLMNLGVVKEVVKYARSKEKEHNKNFRFTMTTNGMLLNDETTEFLNKEMHNIVLSIDGRAEVNDKMRPTINSKGSYDIILPKYQKLVNQRMNGEYVNDQYYVRGTFTKHNLDFTEDVISMYKSGFDQISVEPVVAESNADYALTEADLPRVYEEY